MICCLHCCFQKDSNSALNKEEKECACSISLPRTLKRVVQKSLQLDRSAGKVNPKFWKENTPREVRAGQQGLQERGCPVRSRFFSGFLLLSGYSGLAHSTWNRAASAEKRFTSNLAPAPSRRKRSWTSISTQKAPRPRGACADDFLSPAEVAPGGGASLCSDAWLVFCVVVCFCQVSLKVISIFFCQELLSAFRDSLVNDTPRFLF
jgi:hypothetical protein